MNIITISEKKSLSKAADKLLVTQPALSQQLNKLEKELDTKLFEREKNELVLTDAGKVYVNGARSVLSIYNNAIKKISKIRTSGKKQITMVYNNALLPSFTMAILPAFTGTYSDYFISTIDGNSFFARDYLLNNMADIAVLATKESTHSMLEYISLRTDELKLAVPAGHPCTESFRKNGVDFRLLQNDPFILNLTNSYFRICEKEILSSCQFTPNVLCEISDLNASRHMVANHKGIAFLPKSMEAPGAGYVSFSLQPPEVFNVVIAYQKSLIPSKALRDLISLIKQNCL